MFKRQLEISIALFTVLMNLVTNSSKGFIRAFNDVEILFYCAALLHFFHQDLRYLLFGSHEIQV